MLVYAITNSVDGRRYIGMTKCALGARWSQHKKSAKAGVKTYLYAAMRKHGFAAFRVEMLAQVMPGFDRGVLADLERALIAQEGTLVPNGYNMTPGGDGLPSGEANPNFGRKASEQRCAKIKAGWTDERRAKAVESARKNFHNAETREKVNVALKSESFAVKARANWTPERRAAAAERALVLCATRKPWTPERRAAQAERMRNLRSVGR